MNTLEWKKLALDHLLEYEKLQTVYGHSSHIKSNEKGNIFYQIPEKRISPEQLKALVRTNAGQQLPSGHRLSETMIENALQLIELSKEHITSLSSFFFMIETSWNDVDPTVKRDSFYSHYHPPRAEKNHLNTISYMRPIALSEPVRESFNYINLLNHGESGRPYTVWANPHEDLLNEFSGLAEKMQNKKWNTLPFSDSGTLEIRFDSCNLLHNLKNICSNIFLVLVINDVEFKEVLQPGEIRFRYLKDI